MKEPVRKRYAIKISAKGEESLIRRSTLLYDGMGSFLEEAIFLHAPHYEIVPVGDDCLVMLDLPQNTATSIIRDFLFLCDGNAKQIQVSDEEIADWKKPEKVCLIQMDEEAMRRMTERVEKRVQEKTGGPARYRNAPPCFLLSMYYDVFAKNEGWWDKADHVSVFATHEQMKEILSSLSEICGDHIEVLESGSVSDYEKGLRK